jgi:hypothetical protein
LLTEQRERRNHVDLPPLAIQQILSWANRRHEEVGRWPTRHSGAIPEAPGETWNAVDFALTRGRRGLPAGESLSALLTRCRGKRNHLRLPNLQLEQILDWADEHFARTGRLPAVKSGPIPKAAGTTWHAVDAALRKGLRGLFGGSSLAKLLKNRPAPAPQRAE